jgi:hypothetical protein
MIYVSGNFPQLPKFSESFRKFSSLILIDVLFLLLSIPHQCSNGKIDFRLQAPKQYFLHKLDQSWFTIELNVNNIVFLTAVQCH